jgi:hypothetical protein
MPHPWSTSRAGKIRALRAIEEDARADAMKLDGQLFTGLTTGTNFGQVYTSLAALARMFREHLEQEEAREEASA